MTLEEKRIKQINTATIVLIALTFALVMFMPEASAASDKLKNWVNIIFNGVGESIQKVFESDIYKTLLTGEMDSAAYPIIDTVFDMCKGLGMLWVVVIAMGHLFTNIDRGQDPTECVFKVLMEIAITGVFIMNLDLVVEYLAKFGTAILNFVSGGSDATKLKLEMDDSAVNQFLIDLTGHSSGAWAWEAQAFIILAAPYLMSYLLKIVAQFCVYQIILEAAVRKAFLPMAVADIYQEGLRSPGVRYMKKFLACFLKMACCLVTAALVGPLMSGASSLAGDSKAIYCIVINFTCVGFMFKTGEIANDIVGA